MRSGANTSRTSDTWAKLYDLESGARRAGSGGRRGPGRPARPVKRHKKTVELTDVELKGLEELQAALADRLQGASRGQVVGVAIWALTQQLRTSRKGEIHVPESVTTWAELLVHLER